VTLYGYTFWADTPPGETGNWHEAAYPDETISPGINPHSGTAERRELLASGYSPWQDGVYRWQSTP
jgi:hypothetical protein